jgi:branched-chain amino acid transport system substrate-binding protein
LRVLLRIRHLLFLVLAVGLVAAGCGDDGSSSAESTADDSTTTTAAGDDAAEPEPELSGEPIKIGVLLTMSGPAANIGQLLKVPAEFWYEENKDIGIDGRPVEMVFRDDGGTASTAATAARQLLDEDGVDVVLGPALSDPSSGALPLLTDAKVVSAVVSAFQPARDPAQFPYTFGFEFGSAHQGEAFLRAVQESGGTKVGYIAPNNTLGNAQLDVIKAKIDEAGLELVGSQFYEPGATDVTTQVQNLESDGADVIIVGDVVQPAINTVLDAILTIGWDDVRIVGLSPLADYAVVSAADPSVLERGIATGFTPNTLNPLPPEVADWRDRYLEFIGNDDVEKRLYQIMRPYEALDFLRDMIEATGGTDADAIKEYIEGEGEWEGLTGTYVFTAEAHTGIEDDASANPGTYDNGAYDPVD